ncbi:MAG TPA: dihydrodipicolinate reductase C-terminal domain-containing protein [Phycisphaerae bacterium]|nr:dihydrodipicolinate reductase C-terminal domain-containing protein [Phycisphaerae bacterium]
MDVALIGAGKMGRAIETVLADAGHRVVARLTSRGSEFGRSLADSLVAAQPDVALEFTTPTSAAANLETLIQHGTPVVCGTTGWDTAPTVRLANATGTPVMIAANFSIGMAVMKALVAQAARRLAPFDAFEPAIVERHHRAKQDRPSGTARMLAAALAEHGNWPDLQVVGLRQGNQPGEHAVYFDGASECLTVTHQVRDRNVFALGAVRAAEWLCRERPQGFVTFEDFLERAELCVPA